MAPAAPLVWNTRNCKGVFAADTHQMHLDSVQNCPRSQCQLMVHSACFTIKRSSVIDSEPCIIHEIQRAVSRERMQRSFSVLAQATEFRESHEYKEALRKPIKKNLTHCGRCTLTRIIQVRTAGRKEGSHT